MLIFQAKEPEPKSEFWQHGSGQNTWQVKTKAIKERTAHLYNNNEMSDLTILACDENWWFGQTVKDYVVRFIVVDFDLQVGALQAVCWSKPSFGLT